jgi:hypothetical protein
MTDKTIKPPYYDGSGSLNSQEQQPKIAEERPIQLTAEVRKHLSGNPYIFYK